MGASSPCRTSFGNGQAACRKGVGRLKRFFHPLEESNSFFVSLVDKRVHITIQKFQFSLPANKIYRFNEIKWMQTQFASGGVGG